MNNAMILNKKISKAFSYLLRRQPEPQRNVQRVVGYPAHEEAADDDERHLERALGGLAHPLLAVGLGVRQLGAALARLEGPLALYGGEAGAGLGRGKLWVALIRLAFSSSFSVPEGVGGKRSRPDVEAEEGALASVPTPGGPRD